MAKDKLKESVIELSINKDWSKAKLEWDVVNIYEKDSYGTCLCGKYPIVEICELSNRNNQNKIIVWNECMKYFFEEDFGYIFKSIKRIRKDINKTVDEEVIHYAVKQWRISPEDAHRYVLPIKQRKPVPFKLEWRHKFNKLLLQHFIK